MNERRAPRQPIRRELTGEVTIFRPLNVSDLSTTGARVETSDALRIGSIRVFRLNLGDQTVVVRGRVAHAQVHTLETRQVVYTSGVEFVDVADAVRGSIDAYLRRTGQRGVAAEHGDDGE